LRSQVPRRVLETIPTLLGVTVFIFLLTRALPGDPVVIFLGSSPASPAAYEAARKALGLDQPLYVQYFDYMSRLLQGDWGRSIQTQLPVFPLITDRLGNTLVLASISMVIAVAIGLPLGILSALKRSSLVDRLSQMFSMTFYSIPTFWLGILLLWFFAVYLRVLPGGAGGLGINFLILPAFTIAIREVGFISRLTRTFVLDTESEDHVMAARARGLPSLLVNRNYILRNAMVPIVTFLGLELGSLVEGTVITELVFAYPGIGSLIDQSILTRDYPIIQGSVLLVGLVFILINLVVDIAYSYIDPRIRLGKIKA
jgi:ABC-type dipeptide/oligopeptide/nickel transport system permease component